MKQLATIFLFTVMCFAISCSKQNDNTVIQPSLPVATQTGANTFGCLLNGKVWLPNYHDQNSPPVSTSIDNQNAFSLFTQRIINTGGHTTSDISFTWYVTNVKDTGTYFLDDKNPYAAEFFDFLNSTNNYHYVPDHNQCWIHISHLDLNQKIVSGTFKLLFIGDRKDSARISDGRFDWKLK